MSYLLRLEAIGDDAAALNRTIVRSLEAAGAHDAARQVDTRPRRPWVAELVGMDPDYGFERNFLRGRRDYRRANSKGSRGIYLYFRLESGCVYEVNDLVSWRKTDRYFCWVQGGHKVRLSRDEVEAWLR